MAAPLEWFTISRRVLVGGHEVETTTYLSASSVPDRALERSGITREQLRLLFTPEPYKR